MPAFRSNQALLGTLPQPMVSRQSPQLPVPMMLYITLQSRSLRTTNLHLSRTVRLCFPCILITSDLDAVKREPGTDHDSSPSNDHHPPATDQDEGALLTQGQPPAGTLTEVKNEVPSNYDEEQANVVAVSEQVDEIRITTTQLTTNGSTVSERTVTTSKRTAVVEAHRTR